MACITEGPRAAGATRGFSQKDLGLQEPQGAPTATGHQQGVSRRPGGQRQQSSTTTNQWALGPDVRGHRGPGPGTKGANCTRLVAVCVSAQGRTAMRRVTLQINPTFQIYVLRTKQVMVLLYATRFSIRRELIRNPVTTSDRRHAMTPHATTQRVPHVLADQRG